MQQTSRQVAVALTVGLLAVPAAALAHDDPHDVTPGPSVAGPSGTPSYGSGGAATPGESARPPAESARPPAGGGTTPSRPTSGSSPTPRAKAPTPNSTPPKRPATRARAGQAGQQSARQGAATSSRARAETRPTASAGRSSAPASEAKQAVRSSEAGGRSPSAAGSEAGTDPRPRGSSPAGPRSDAPARAVTARVGAPADRGGWELWALGLLLALLGAAGGGFALAWRRLRRASPQEAIVAAEPAVLVEPEPEVLVAPEPEVVEPEPDPVEAELQEIVAEGRARTGDERSELDELVSVD